ncbi:MAG: S-layer homology domain-containing protein, partial [Chloroflexia bacterium]
MASTNPGNISNKLLSTVAIAENNVWAVGTYNNGSVDRTLIEHWNGNNWTTVTSPNVGSSNNNLTGVAALSATDIWATGTYGNTGSGTQRTLTMHWNGGVWTIVTSPNIGSGSNRLRGMHAVSATNVYAVGFACPTNCTSDSTTQSLILRWDGTSWSTVTVPNYQNQNNYLYNISGDSPNNLWTIGEHNTCWGCAASTHTLHYDGTAWTIVNSPNVGSSTNTPQDVAVLANDDAWFVGQYYDAPNARWKTLIEHWDGTAWSVVSSPNQNVSYNDLHSVVAISPNDIWAVGEWQASSSLTLHWDGTAWTIVPNPDGVSGTNVLNGVSALSSNYVWAVGTNSDHTLIQLYSDSCATPTISLSPTSTLTSTSTPTVPSSTTSTPVPTCELEWSITGSDNPGTQANRLLDVAAQAQDDVWAVGTYNNGSADKTLVEHWDGSEWNVVDSPNIGSVDNTLVSVSVVSASDIWAVGTYFDSVGQSDRTLTLHYDGIEWSVIYSPNIGSGNNRLHGVYATATDDVWGSGFACNGDCLATFPESQSLILHWDGTAWSIVTVPNTPGQNNYLYKIAGSSGSNIWTAGEHNTCWGCAASILTLHYDGTTWSIVDSPNAGNSTNTPHDIAVIAEDDAWIVGQFYDGVWKTMTLHWNGTEWSVVASPNLNSSYNDLGGVAAISSDDIWAVGEWGGSDALTMHWDGTEWNVVNSPNSEIGTNALYGVSALSSEYVWAVGMNMSSSELTLTQLYSDPCDTPTPIPTSTAAATETPEATGTPASTETPIETPTDIPEATPTACNIVFTDLAVDSTFYKYGRCLACPGIISGYPDGTFRPSNSVTRGQL